MTMYRTRHDDAQHEDAYLIVAFNDKVGIACSEGCAQACCDDIHGDYGDDAEAGYEPASRGDVRQHRRCMSCGAEVTP